MGGKRFFRLVMKVFLVSILTTILLMIYLAKNSNDDEIYEVAQQKKMAIREELRSSKLKKLQMSMFPNPNRPSDKEYNINVTLSEKIPLDRDIPDSRPNECKTINYDYSKMPKTTVIIPLYNEALSMLLRTVHSILARTPRELLAEIILVDDHSFNRDLQEMLENYIKLLPQVQLIRTERREGLIRARLIGARMAKGDILMFQDAHMENNAGWLEPLVAEIQRNHKVIIQPEIDAVHQSTLKYEPASGTVPRGGFTWDLRYTWMQMPKHEQERLSTPTQPFRTPTLVGCAIAVHKEYFFDIGAFDEGMNIWGGENIELAVRNWLCGGEVLTSPCSRVAHTFKPFAYKFDGDREKIVQKNQMRLAELWMDDYKKFFYAATWTWPNKRVFLDKSDLRSLTKRQVIKQKFQCKKFDWYMKNIVPEIPTPPTSAWFYGEVANLRTEACFEAAKDGYVTLTYFCFFHRTVPENIFQIDHNERLKFGNQCVHVEPSTWLMRLGSCDSNPHSEKWVAVGVSDMYGVPYEVEISLTLSHEGKTKKLCVTQVTNVNKVHYRKQMPQLMDCEDGDKFQQWRFTYKFDFNYKFPVE